MQQNSLNLKTLRIPSSLSTLQTRNLQEVWNEFPSSKVTGSLHHQCHRKSYQHTREHTIKPEVLKKKKKNSDETAINSGTGKWSSAHSVIKMLVRNTIFVAQFKFTNYLYLVTFNIALPIPIPVSQFLYSCQYLHTPELQYELASTWSAVVHQSPFFLPMIMPWHPDTYSTHVMVPVPMAR